MGCISTCCKNCFAIFEPQMLDVEVSRHSFLQHGDLHRGDADQRQQQQHDEADEQYDTALAIRWEGTMEGTVHLGHRQKLVRRLRKAIVVSYTSR